MQFYKIMCADKNKMRIFLSIQLVLLLGLIDETLTATTERSPPDMEEIKRYLEVYHYYGKENPDPTMKQLVAENNTGEALRQAFLTYQKTWGLPESGDLNLRTLNMINIPRCGMPDIQTVDDINYLGSDIEIEGPGFKDRNPDVQVGNPNAEVEHRFRHGRMRHERRHHRVRRYMLSGHEHYTLGLTYKMISYPSNGPERHVVDQLVDMAYKTWQDASKLTFTRVQGDENADIIMSFNRSDHQDYKGQERASNELAHAFYPNVFYNGSQIHYNDDKTWIDGIPSGHHEADLAYVTLHEIGHALGLGHVLHNNKSVMHPYYERGEKLQLHADDINGINALYGDEMDTLDEARNKTMDEVVPMDIEPMMSDFCNNGTVDAITTRNEGGVLYVYVFQGNAYVRMRDGSIEAGYPRLISKDWPGLPNDIEAISNPDQFHSNGNDFVETLRFVKDGMYYNFEGQELKSKRAIETMRIPHRDAIFNFGKTGREYHVSGGRYYHLRARGWRKLEFFLPFFKDIPIDAAFSLDMKTSYFFSGTDFYVVQTVDNPKRLYEYPQNIANDFFHCGPATIMMHMGDQTSEVNTQSSSAHPVDRWRSVLYVVILFGVHLLKGL